MAQSEFRLSLALVFSLRQILAMVFFAGLVGLQGIGLWMNERIASHQQQQQVTQHKLVSVHCKFDECQSIIWQGTHEVMIAGKLFDVVSMQNEEQGFTLQGFYDEEEDEMRAVYQGNQKKSDYLGNAVPFFVPLFFEELPTYAFSGYFSERALYYVQNQEVLSVILSEKAPPPKSFI